MFEKKIEVVVPDFFTDSVESENTYVYGSVRDLTVSYTNTNLTDLSGNDIGSAKYDLKTLVLPGDVNINFTAVYKFNLCNDEYFAYIAGIRNYEIVNGGVRVDYENVVVTSFVKNGKKIDNVSLEIILAPNNKFLLNVFTIKC
jgi:hypothetical protein